MKNVLILLADQQRHDTIAAAGFPHMKTPALDRLAQEGTCYPNAYSSNPVCMPARHDLMTGRTGRAHGYFMNGKKPIRSEALETLPRMFLHAGYRTAAIGKMHFFPVRAHHGFGEMRLMEELPYHRANDEYATYLKNEGLDTQNLHGVRPHFYHVPQRSQQDWAHHGTNWVAEQTLDWLQSNGDAPFFLVCGFVHPHPPWNIPDEWAGLYDGADIPGRIPRCRNAQDIQEDSAWFGDHDTPETIRAERAAYYTAVSMIDNAVGRILDRLRETGQLENTLVVYTSDHGEMLGDRGYFSKELPYEGASRIPMLVRYPQGEQGQTDSRFCDLLDILPTCADVCGLPIDESAFPGRSLRAQQRKTVQVSASGDGKWRWIMARDARHKFIHYYNGGIEECFDLKSDPQELHPDAPVPPQLRQAAIDWEAQYGPEECICDGAFVDLPFEKLHPSVRSKYHFWENVQMQQFDEREDRQEALLAEMRHALPGWKQAGLLDDPEWRNQFVECLNQYGKKQYTVEEVFL